MKYIIIGNKIVTAVYFVCATVAAIAMDKPYLLWWYVFGLILFLLNPAEKEGKND